MTLEEAARLALERAELEWRIWTAERTLVYLSEGVLDQRSSLGSYQWCGAFAAFCWQEVHPELRKRLWPSVYRLLVYADYGVDRNLWPASLAARFPRIEPPRVLVDVRDGNRAEIRPGDICLVGVSKPRHITLASSIEDVGLHTISGNGLGLLAGGGRGRGVVKNLVPWPQVWYAIRPASADLQVMV